jgi:hypothetical protein
VELGGQLALDGTVPPDPNEDVVGYEFDSDHGRLRVTGTTKWSTAYVECVTADGSFVTVRAVERVRAHQA